MFAAALRSIRPLGSRGLKRGTLVARDLQGNIVQTDRPGARTAVIDHGKCQHALGLGCTARRHRS